MSESIKNSITRWYDFRGRRRLTHKVLAGVSGQMAEMLDAGVDLKLVFFALEKNTGGRSVFRHQTWKSMLEEGHDVSEIFQVYEFPAMFVNTVEAGEKSGQLVASLTLLHEYYQKIAELRAKAVQAAIYPSVVLLTVAFSLYFMIGIVLPNFRNLYHGMGLEVPEYTQMLFSTQRWLHVYKMHIVVWVGIAILIAFLCIRLVRIRNFLLGCCLYMPLFGRYVRYRNTYVLVTQMSMLMRGGVSVQEAFVNIRHLFSGAIARRIETMHGRVVAGAVLSESLHATRCFDEQLIRFIEMGESTGRLTAAFVGAEVYYSQKIKRILSLLIKGIEPFALLVTGVFILFIILAMLLPIFNLINVM